MKLSRDNLTRIGFGIALLIMLAIATVSYRVEQSQARTAAMVAYAEEVLESLDVIQSSMNQAESAARGFMLAGDAQYLDSFQNANATQQAALRNLERLTESNPAQQRRLERLQLEIERKTELHEQRIRIRRTEGFKAALDSFLTGQDHRLMDNLRSRIAEMKSEEKRLLQIRQKEAGSESKRSLLIIAVGFALSSVILVAVYFRLSLEVRRRRNSE